MLLQGDDAERRLGGVDQSTDPRVNQNRVETEIGVIESNLVQDAVEEELGHEPGVSVSAEGETDIVRISATWTEPEEAASEANRYAGTYVEWKRQRTIGLVPVIADAGGEHDLATLEAPTSPAAEAYRTLRTAVQFIDLEQPLRAIQVTSAKPTEGKTTTASNLAVTLAQAGKRVILLDADLRKPRLHHEFDLPNKVGFTSMLLDANLSAGAFHRTDVKNLVVVPSGPPPPNPSELLSLQASRRVIELLRSECDVLMVDSPPVLPVTDPMILSGLGVGSARGWERRAVEVGREHAAIRGRRVEALLCGGSAGCGGISVGRSRRHRGGLA